jgi:adenylate cyclase
MGIKSNVVFADLYGSTGVFEALGNVSATAAVTQITSWIGEKFSSNGGRVVKFLGDGVLAVFSDSQKAIDAVVETQRAFQQKLAQMPHKARMPIRIGVVLGEVELVGDDCYGDAVNIASRLSEQASAHQILIHGFAIEHLRHSPDVQFRKLGAIPIRGRSEPCVVYQVDWQDAADSEFLTILASTAGQVDANLRDALGGQVDLSWLDVHKSFMAFDLPVHIGRGKQAQLVVNDPRVSRDHARVDWRNGSVSLVDVSSFGCWVRFAGGGSDLLLRRSDCVLHGRGEIALGSSFSDPSAPVVSFMVY